MQKKCVFNSASLWGAAASNIAERMEIIVMKHLGKSYSFCFQDEILSVPAHAIIVRSHVYL